MQIRPQEKKKIILAGAFLGVMLFITGATIFVLGKERSIFDEKKILYTDVVNAQNLKTGAFIQFKGIKVGTVETIDVLNLEKIRITFNIKSDKMKWIRKDSFIMFRTEGVLGDKFLEILGGTSDSPAVKANSHIPTKQGPNLEKFINKGEDIVVTAARVLNRLDNILERLDNKSLDSILSNFEATSVRSKEIAYSINPNDVKKFSSSLGHFQSTMSNFNDISNQIKTGPGSANSFIYDRALYEQLNTLLGGANRSKVLKYFIRESIKDSATTSN